MIIDDYIELKLQEKEIKRQIAEIQDEVLAAIEENGGKIQHKLGTISKKAAYAWTYSGAAQRIFMNNKTIEEKIKRTEQETKKATVEATYSPRFQEAK